MLGLRRGSVQLVAYNPAWATLFEAERARLHHALHPNALDIQHIGSTGVPGLAAKPILDLCELCCSAGTGARRYFAD